MFTGIVTALGQVAAMAPAQSSRDLRLTLATPPGWLAGAELGASIACAGCCLTAISFAGDSFAVEVSAETRARTTLGGWRVGQRVNLERSLKLGDEMGGHIVSGHVDGLGRVLSVEPEGGSARWRFALPAPLARFVAVKGSIAVEGCSLTVNEVGPDWFGVTLIPHTQAVTGFATLRPGDAVNLEIDMLARYVARLADTAP
jgi:riboflavin synthase